MKDQKSLDEKETAYEKWDRAKGLMLESYINLIIISGLALTTKSAIMNLWKLEIMFLT